jgi:TetR/AcrR family transcriptional repressor of lmrAB and yxaGH operons
MAVKKTDRDAVMDAAMNLFRVKGYHHTSMADIAEACGLLKGSVYHYFSGKKDMALAVLDGLIDEARRNLFAPAKDASIPAGERLGLLVSAVEGYFVGREGGCLMGNLALELGNADADFANRIRTYFNDWKDALAVVLAEEHGMARAEELAEDAIARAQGAIMMMGLYRNDAVFRRAGEDTLALLGLTPSDAKAAA